MSPSLPLNGSKYLAKDILFSEQLVSSCQFVVIMSIVIQLVLLFVGLEGGVQAVNFVLFGDSVVESNGCFSELVGYQVPPSPPYSNLTRYSSYKVWADYFGEALENEDMEIIDCSCSGAMAIGDGPTSPGMISQIARCNDTQDLADVAYNEDLVAILMFGGNDLFYEVTGLSGYPSVSPESFAEVFELATRQLLEIGVQNVLIGNTVMMGIYAPFQTFFMETFTDVAAASALLQSELITAQEEGLAKMKSEGLSVENFPFDKFLSDIQNEAIDQGLNAYDSCFNLESLFDYSLVSILPDCTELDERMWIDGLHMADWGHQQFSQLILDFIISQQII
eukprot:TRINITY_DN1478_c0_g1_i1.p1 TRINITY_DN1478_c0_g1~~TRINITY_DN1478_c0_g1_i1.p1  ORF type:complete len:336 (+),score=52.43 TRINITY_DN1478_c0_g1_i1:133-1140(+)